LIFICILVLVFWDFLIKQEPEYPTYQTPMPLL